MVTIDTITKVVADIRNVLEKPAQEMPFKETSGRKRTALQQLVNISLKIRKQRGVRRCQTQG